MPHIIGYLVLGIGFFLYGASTIAREAAAIGRGPEWSKLKLRGTPAIIFGFSLLIGAFVVSLPFLMYFFDQNAFENYGIAFFYVAFIIAIGGFLFGGCVQMAISAGATIKIYREKSSDFFKKKNL